MQDVFCSGSNVQFKYSKIFQPLLPKIVHEAPESSNPKIRNPSILTSRYGLSSLFACAKIKSNKILFFSTVVGLDCRVR